MDTMIDETRYADGMKWVFENSSMISGSINPDCIDDYGSDDAYNCIFAQNVARYTKLDGFALQSKLNCFFCFVFMQHIDFIYILFV